MTQEIYISNKVPSLKYRIAVVQSDSGRTVRFLLADDDVTQYTGAKLFGVKPSGAKLFLPATISNGGVECKLTDQMLAEVGITEVQVALYAGEEVVSTFTCYVDVRRSQRDDAAIESTDDFSALQEALKTVDDISGIKRDLDQLKNEGTGGLNQTAKNLLITILGECLTGTDQTDNIAALAEALSKGGSGEEGGDTPDVPTPPVDDTYWTVTNNLTGYTTDNTATKVQKDNAFYTATLTMGDGYDSGTITVTMGGVDVTESAVNGGFILIQNVTGNIVVTATAVKLTEVGITDKVTASILDVYEGSVEDTTPSLQYNVIGVVTDGVPSENGKVIFTLSNNTENDITLNKAYIGIYETPKPVKRPDGVASGAVVISNAKTITGKVLSGGTLTFDVDVEVGEIAYISGFGDCTVTAKADVEFKPVLDGFEEILSTAQLLGYKTPSFYDGENEQSTVINNNGQNIYKSANTYSKGVYWVEFLAPSNTEFRIGSNTDGSLNYYNSVKTSPATTNVPTFVRLTITQDNSYLYFNRQNQTAVYVKKVGDL